MADQLTLFKGEKMEELLRNYFLNSGYYVVRGVQFKYENHDITDIDLYLYSRSSSIARQRINVDIKNRKTPQAFERILWANGLMKLLNFDSCIVATTDSRAAVTSFGQIHNTTILNGVFLKKLESITSVIKLSENRLSEEGLLAELSNHKDYKQIGNKTWKDIYQASKSKLLTEQDFSGFNSILPNAEYFVEKILTDSNKREIAARMLYLTVSYLLIIVDFIIKDIAFLEQTEKEKKLLDGFKYGNFGKIGIDKIIEIAVILSENKASAASIQKLLENVKFNVLKDFFGNNENGRNLFSWGRDFEAAAFAKHFISPEELDSSLKGVLSILLDYFGIDRRKFFEVFGANP